MVLVVARHTADRVGAGSDAGSRKSLGRAGETGEQDYAIPSDAQSLGVLAVLVYGINKLNGFEVYDGHWEEALG